MVNFVEFEIEGKVNTINLDRVARVVYGEESRLYLNTGSILVTSTPVEELKKRLKIDPVVCETITVSSYDYLSEGHRVMVKKDFHQVYRENRWEKFLIPAGSVGMVSGVYEVDWEQMAHVVFEGVEGQINAHPSDLVRLLVDKPVEG